MGLTLRAMTDAEYWKKLREELREFGLLKAVTDRLNEIMTEIRSGTSYPVYGDCMEKCEDICALLEMDGKYNAGAASILTKHEGGDKSNEDQDA